MTGLTSTLRHCGRAAAIAAACVLAAGCSSKSGNSPSLGQAPELSEITPAGQARTTLPAPLQPVYAAVSEFRDLTGSRKPNDNFAEFSTAVTQGAGEYLTDALYRAGGGAWFEVVERAGLEAILQERNVIRATRQQFEGGAAAQLPPLKFAGVLIQGGVVAYDSNLVTGGAGARYLGVGAATQHRRDRVTVVMRAVSVKSGTVLASVSTSKTIYSKLVEGSVFSFVSFDEILELEAGTSRNEPPQLAVRQAIELAVYALVMEGASRGVWSFQSADGQALVHRYLAAKQGHAPSTIIEPPRNTRRGLLRPLRRNAADPAAATAMAYGSAPHAANAAGLASVTNPVVPGPANAPMRQPPSGAVYAGREAEMALSASVRGASSPTPVAPSSLPFVGDPTGRSATYAPVPAPVAAQAPPRPSGSPSYEAAAGSATGAPTTRVHDPLLQLSASVPAAAAAPRTAASAPTPSAPTQRPVSVSSSGASASVAAPYETAHDAAAPTRPGPPQSIAPPEAEQPVGRPVLAQQMVAADILSETARERDETLSKLLDERSGR